MSKFKCELFKINTADTDSARAANLKLLREGVSDDVLGIFMGNDLNSYAEEVKDLVPRTYFVSSVEIYANGAANFFLREESNPKGRYDLVIRVRP